MKFGMNLLLWTTHVTEELFPTLEKLKRTGFDGVEIPLFEGDVAHYRKIKKELDNLGLGCTAVCVATPTANPISDDPAVRKAAVAHLTEKLDLAAALGADALCGPYHSPLGVFSGEPPTSEEKKRGAEVLRQVAEEGQKRKIKLAIEYLNRFECYFLTTAADAAAFVKQVDHPNFRTMYDTFHANIEEKSPAAGVQALGNLFIHVHISENDRGIPGTGMVHWDETFAALKKANYDGWMTVEAFGRALPALAAATKVWRDLFPKAEDVYTRGLQFMKEKWGAAGK
jgi:D-psicose/D-tagatose/L-ribulose 3-epimerase